MAPTAVDVDHTTSSRSLILATGTTALLLAAVLVVALAPSRSSAPIAVSATTLPPASIELRVAPTEVSTARDQNVLTFHNMTSPGRGIALLGAPNAVSAAPEGDANDLAVASALPDEADRVIVLTTSHAYTLRWGQIDDITAPNGSIVMTHDGSLVATFVSGELRLLVN
ncbi:hypothetical protein [Ilumatobacter sp.]|uniref:hypothetical protein n=1 Tax=Ilumatobacter sp. TaxID=1967498 RepID=UPI003C3CC559